MACFMVPMAEAIVVTAVNKITAKGEAAEKKEGISGEQKIVSEKKLTFHDKVNWLSNMLWGGSALLAFEHLWHGEIEPWFPFLTAAKNPAQLTEVLNEMATNGVGMALLVTFVWGIMLFGVRCIEKRGLATQKTK